MPNLKRILLILLLISLSVISAVLLRQNTKTTHSNKITAHVLAVGDTGTGDSNQKMVAKQLAHNCNNFNCDAVILLGDIIYPSGVTSSSDNQFQTKFENIYKSIKTVFYIVLGNHDYNGCVDCYIQYSTQSAKWKIPKTYYTFTIRSLITFIVLDTEKLDNVQTLWANEEISHAQTPWVIVAGHHPLIAHDTVHGDMTGDKKTLLENILCNKNVNAYIAGHSHLLEDAGTKCGTHLLVAGGGGAQLYTSADSHPPFIASTYGFISITATPKNLLFEFINVQGKILHTVPINK